MEDRGDDLSSIANSGNQDAGSNSWGMHFSDKLTGLHNQTADHVINNLLLFNENDEIQVVKSLLDTLVEGRFDLWTNCIIKSPSHIHIIIFGLLPRLNEELQIHLLDTFINIVERHVRNAEICRKYKLPQHIISMLLSKESFVQTMLRKLKDRFIRLLEAIGKHSFTTVDLFHYFRPFSHPSGSPVADIIIDTMLGTAISTQLSRPPPCLDMDGTSISVSSKVGTMGSPIRNDAKSFSAKAAEEAFDRADIQHGMDIFLSPPKRNNSSAKSAFDLHLQKVEENLSNLGIRSQNGLVILPNLESWPSGGYSFCLHLRPEGIVDRVSEPLFVFQGNERHGVAAYIVGRHLLFKTLNGDGKDAETLIENVVDVKRWRWLCITHVSRALWRSKLSVFIDGQPVFSKRHAYPVAASMSSIDSYIGGFQGQIGPIMLFNSALSDTNVKTLFRLTSNLRFSIGPPPEIWKRTYFRVSYSVPLTPGNDTSLNSCTNDAKVPQLKTNYGKFSADEGETLWKNIYDKLVFAYDPRHRTRHRDNGRILIQLLDLSYNRRNGTLLSPEYGTRIISTNFLLQDAVACGGGAFSLFLPLLIPALSTNIDVDWPLKVVDHVKDITPARFIKIIRLVSALLRNSDTNFVQLGIANGVNILSWILKNSDRNIITLDLWSAINELTNVIASGPDNTMASDAVTQLMFNLHIWSLATFDTQSQILSALQSKLSLASYVLRTSLVQNFLDFLKLIYDPNLASIHTSFCERKEGSKAKSCKGFTKDELYALRKGVFTLIETLVTEEEDRNIKLLYEHVTILLDNVRNRKDILHAKDVLEVLMNIIARSERLPNTLRCLVHAGAGKRFVLLLDSDDEQIRKYALKLIHLLLAQRRFYNLKQNVSGMQDEDTSKQYQQESLAFIQTINHRGIIHVGSQDDYGYQGRLTEAIAAEIKYNLSQSQYTAGIHIGLMEILCSSALENHLPRSGKQYLKSLQSATVHNETSAILDVVFEMAKRSQNSCSTKIKIMVLRDLCILCRHSPQNRKTLRQRPLYLRKLFSLIYSLTDFDIHSIICIDHPTKTLNEQTRTTLIKAILSPTQALQSVALWLDKLGSLHADEAWSIIVEVLRKAGSKLQPTKAHIYASIVNFVTDQLAAKIPNLIYEFLVSITVDIVEYRWVPLEHLSIMLKQASIANTNTSTSIVLQYHDDYSESLEKKFSGFEKYFFRDVVLRVLKLTYNSAKHKVISPERLPKDGALKWDGAEKAAKTWNSIILLLHCTTDFVLGDSWGNSRSIESYLDDIEFVSSTLLLWGALAADLGAKPGSGVDIIPNNVSNSSHKKNDIPSVISNITRPVYPNVVQRLLQLVFHTLQIDCQGIEDLGNSGIRFLQSAVHISSILQRLLHMIKVLDNNQSQPESDLRTSHEMHDWNQNILLWMIPILHSLISRVRTIETSVSSEEVIIFRKKLVEIIGNVVRGAEEILRRKGGDELFTNLNAAVLSGPKLDNRLAEWEMYLCNPLFLNTKMKFEETIGAYRKQLNSYQAELVRLYKTWSLDREIIQEDAVERLARDQWKKISSRRQNNDLDRLRKRASFDYFRDYSAQSQCFKILHSLASSHNPWTWNLRESNIEEFQNNILLNAFLFLEPCENNIRMRMRIKQFTDLKGLQKKSYPLSDAVIDDIDEVDEGIHSLKSRTSLDENIVDDSETEVEAIGSKEPPHKNDLDASKEKQSGTNIGATDSTEVLEVAEIAFGQSFYHSNKNEKITFGTIAELILPMCVVKGRLELSAEALYFYGEGFGGAGQDTSSKQIDAKALLRERWIDDNSTNKCYGCNIEIKSGIISSGKHHCRRCGGIFCSDCTKHECVLPSLGFHEPVRVCEKCFEIEQNKRGEEGVLSVVAQQYSRVLESSTKSSLEYLKTRRIALNDIIDIRALRYLLRPCALEVVAGVRRTAYFFNFVRGKKDAEKFFNKLMFHKPSQLASIGLFGIGISLNSLTPKNILSRTDWTSKWRKREMSNFEYLMKINTIAGRSYNDLTQYPVFPWVISDYESKSLNLQNPMVYRNLRKPIGALNEKRLKQFQLRYEQLKEDPSMETPFMYGTHYSNVGSVLYYLVRLEPFTKHSRDLQGGNLDHAERLFHSIPEAWKNVLHNPSDVKELIPEVFYLPEILENINKIDLGVRQDGTKLDDVKLPPWAKSAEEFVRIQREALESEYVSLNLNHWIDLIFGYKQTGEEAFEANNVFHHLTYEGAVDVDAIQDPIQRKAVEAQIANFGQMPSQIFTRPHPSREPLNSLQDAMDGVYISFRKFITGTISVILLTPDSEEVVVVSDSGFAKKIRFSSKKQSVFRGKNFPFTLTCVQTQESRPLSNLPRPTARRVIIGPKGESIISGGFFDWTFKITNLNYKPVTSPVLKDYLPIIQSIYHHRSHVTCLSSAFMSKPRNSEEDATMYVVAGSSDGTITIWEFLRRSGGSAKFDMLSKLSSNFGIVNDISGPLQWIHGHRAKVTCVALQVDIGVVISGAADGVCLIHDVWDGQYIRSLNVSQWEEGWGNSSGDARQGNSTNGNSIDYKSRNAILHVHVSNTGKIVIATKFCVHIFRLNGVHLCCKKFEESISCIHVSDDSRFIVVVTKFSSACFWLHNFQPLKVFCLVDKTMDEAIVESAAGTVLINCEITASALRKQGDALFIGLDDGTILCIHCKLNWQTESGGD